MATKPTTTAENSITSGHQPAMGEFNGDILVLTPEEARAFAIKRDAEEAADDEGFPPDDPRHDAYVEKLAEIEEAAIPEIEPPTKA